MFESSLYSLHYHYLVDLLCFLADGVDSLEFDGLNSFRAILVCQLLISSSFSHLLTLDVRIRSCRCNSLSLPQGQALRKEVHDGFFSWVRGHATLLLRIRVFAQRICSGDILVENGIHSDLEHHFASSRRRSRLLSLSHSSLMHECSPLHVHVGDVDG